MIQVPFHPDSFAREMKPKISGSNLSLEYDNIESSLYKVAARIPDTLSQALYDRLVKAFLSGTEVSEPDATAIDYLQRAMLHFTIYEHLIYIVLRIANDGITTKKTDTETTAYKYQTDELNDNLISTAWFWMNQLIQYLNKQADQFPEWDNSEQKKDLDNLPIDLSDLNKWVGVEMTGGEYFVMSASWIIREVWMDFVCSRFRNPVKTDAIARAVCYQVMGFACQRLAYSCLPSPVRKDIDNEMGKNHRAQADKDIREHVAGKFLEKAAIYWQGVDLVAKKQAIEERKKTAADSPVPGRNNIHEDDKFYFL